LWYRLTQVVLSNELEGVIRKDDGGDADNWSYKTCIVSVTEQALTLPRTCT